MQLHDRQQGFNIAVCVTHSTGVNNCQSGKWQIVWGFPLLEQLDMTHSWGTSNHRRNHRLDSDTIQAHHEKFSSFMKHRLLSHICWGYNRQTVGILYSLSCRLPNFRRDRFERGNFVVAKTLRVFTNSRSSKARWHADYGCALDFEYSILGMGQYPDPDPNPAGYQQFFYPVGFGF